MFSNRIKSVKPSCIVKYNDTVKRREENEGIYFYKLNIGQPNIKTDNIYYKVISSYKEPINSYTNPNGIEELRKTVSNYYNNKIIKNKYNKENIIITQGASDAIIKSLFTLCDKNDEIIILEPFFSDYKIYCDLLEIKIKVVDYSDITLKTLYSAFSEKTKAILFANPNNPDGNVLSENDIDTIIDFAVKNNIFIISDEVYSEILFVDKYFSLSNYNYDKIVIVDSVSKKLNSCGSRIGFIISKNIGFISKISILNDSKISISNIEQIGVNALLLNYKKIAEYNRKIYTRRLNKIVRLLKKTPIKYDVPKGGMSLLLELPIQNCEGYASWLVNCYSNNCRSILIAPANDFYISNKGKNKIRLSLTMNDKDIKDIVDILIDSCKKFALEETIYD